jgi:hypothetical protein
MSQGKGTRPIFTATAAQVDEREAARAPLTVRYCTPEDCTDPRCPNYSKPDPEDCPVWGKAGHRWGARIDGLRLCGGLAGNGCGASDYRIGWSRGIVANG